MTTKVKPTVEKLRESIKKLGNDVIRDRIECKCPTCGDRAYGYDAEIKAKDSWIFVELSSLYERLLSHITEPTHSLISKIPSAYGVGSANLPEGDNWERKFDEAFEGTMCDGTGVDYGDTQREVKDFIRTLLSHSLQEAKAERDENVYLLGGVDALTRYLEFIKTNPDRIKFWVEWYKHVLSLDKSAGIDPFSTPNTKEQK